MNKKILFILGTRPEAIKVAPVILAIKKSANYDVKVCTTGQHREILKQVLDFFDIVPDIVLESMEINQTLAQLSSKLFKEVGLIFETYRPDLVIVHGDTTSAMVGAMVGFYNRIKVGHIEAGLRTFNKFSPFPEEINRQVISRVTDYHFAPTINAATVLKQEGVDDINIIVTGNTVIDALFIGVEKVQSETFNNKQIKYLESTLDFSKKIVLVTGHRRENFGGGFVNICEALLEVSELENIQIVYPVHPNPNVQDPVNKYLSNNDNIVLCDPLDYPAFIWLMKKANIILTDSGGIQEEAPSLKVPVLVLRDTTERPEAIATGHIKLVGTDKIKIVKEVKHLLNNDEYYSSFSKSENPYGDGKSSEIILSYIEKNL